MTIKEFLSRCDNNNLLVTIQRISSKYTISRESLTENSLSLHFDRYEFGIYFDQMNVTFKIFS